MPNNLHHKVTIQIDVTNPGEFFACCGLLELASRLSSGAFGWFEGGLFCLAPSDPTCQISVNKVLQTLVDVNVKRLSDESTSPLELGEPIFMRLNWWLLPDETRSNKLKTWAGNQKSRDMFCKWQGQLKDVLSRKSTDTISWLQKTCYEQGPYGFDSRTGWNALSIGFSLNEHTPYKKLPVRPAVEMLGAIGLQRFFPDITEKNNGAFVSYATWNVPLCPAVARLAALGNLPGITLERLEARVSRRGSYKGLEFAKPLKGDFYA